MKFNQNFSFSLILICVFNLSCSPNSSDNFSSQFPNSTPSNYFKKSTSLIVEIHYESGALPFEGNISSTQGNEPLWNITEENIIELFSARTTLPTISVPKAISEMNLIPDQNKSSWTANDAVDLFERHHNLQPTQTQGVFYIYFVNGFSSSGQSTIAFSVNTTPVILVFKDVITQSGVSNILQRFIEQSTIVHELGHAFGLVNNGIPMVVNHQALDQSAHTQNQDCVMYYLNEGLIDLIPFYTQYNNSGDATLWGPEVLADAFAFSD